MTAARNRCDRGCMSTSAWHLQFHLMFTNALIWLKYRAPPRRRIFVGGGSRLSEADLYVILYYSYIIMVILYYIIVLYSIV